MRTGTGLATVGIIALVVAGGTTGAAQADRGSGSGGSGSGGSDGGASETIRIEDDCDPVTFNAALGEGACVGDGDTEFEEVIAQLLEEGAADKWRNHPDDTHVDAGESLHLKNVGGEAHTFTAVTAFGPGCVGDINNLLGLTGPPAADCGQAFAGLMVPGQSKMLSAAALSPGTHLFQCMIHPWMHATVEVRGHDH